MVHEENDANCDRMKKKIKTLLFILNRVDDFF